MALPDSHVIDNYTAFVMYYAKRVFTSSSDALNAFTGISDGLAARMKCKFIQGIPTSMLDLWIPFLLRPQRSYPMAQHRRTGFPSWSWVGWSQEVTLAEVQQAIAPSAMDAEDFKPLNDWLNLRTWIIYHVNFPGTWGRPRFDHDALTQDIWDESDMERFRHLSDIHVGYRFRSPSPWTLENVPSELFPKRFVLDRGGRDYPFLQFWTMTASFYLESFTGTVTGWSEPDDSNYKLLDRHNEPCGFMRIDNLSDSLLHAQREPLRVLIMSEMHYCQEVQTYNPRSSGGHKLPHRQSSLEPWGFFIVLAVTVDEAGVEERIGVGQIHKSALKFSCTTPTWSEIILG